ncbi:hypothetical protein GRI44_10385 [Altererythrobacter confluentis]|uniref:Methionyl-tRNA formyltransferase n=1 Tax=Allopontixanthobacter confluentis TaxID=1849021 RepID=A0A6L7GHY9_9SPHN|nr:formyltransferase family protein [Allopontixanthobacter confluentis]MXP15155.1 hypothetical protein [Allopontixanthobacter confluentis]
MEKKLVNIYALSAVGAGFDLVHALMARGVELAGVISLSDARDRSAVSGFQLASSARLPADMPVFEVDSYPLASDAAKQLLTGIDIDVLIVAGWQRLVPGWLIDHCNLGVIGLHGSANGISAGRGRSPQNWALISGSDGFEIAAFLIDSGVDSGPVLASARFGYTVHDDIASSYQKSMLLGAQMIARALKDWDHSVRNAVPQTSGEVAYLPQRIAEDGAIDWTLPATVICRHVAALTKPYPGASTVIDGQEMKIWRVRPIGDLPLEPPGVPGEIISVSRQGDLVVATGDGYAMLEKNDFDSAARGLQVGHIFSSRPFSETIDAIINRHVANFPDQPLSADIIKLGTKRP